MLVIPQSFSTLFIEEGSQRTCWLSYSLTARQFAPEIPISTVHVLGWCIGGFYISVLVSNSSCMANNLSTEPSLKASCHLLCKREWNCPYKDLLVCEVSFLAHKKLWTSVILDLIFILYFLHPSMKAFLPVFGHPKLVHVSGNSFSILVARISTLQKGTFKAHCHLVVGSNDTLIVLMNEALPHVTLDVRRCSPHTCLLS